MTAMPLPFHRNRPARKPAPAFTEADIVLARLEDAVRQYDGVLNRLMQVLRPAQKGR